MPLTYSQANKQEKNFFFMRGVILTCHLYKRKGVRSCSLMRQVNRLLWMKRCYWEERVPNFDYVISEKEFSTVY